MERLELHPQNPQPRFIKRTAEALADGCLIIYPTDTVYGLGCDLFNKRAIENIYRLKGSDKRKLLSFICPDLKDIAQYAQVSTPAYKIMKRIFPGPYTVILNATRLVPKLLTEKKKTVGIRVPDNNVCQMLLAELGKPIISTSARLPDQEYLNDPDMIADTFDNLVDIFLDTGFSSLEPSTIIDLSNDEPAVIREGKGPVDIFY